MLNKLLEIVKEKNKIDQNQEWYTGAKIYLDGLKDEVIEVEEELKENNSVYLEDELGDILWDLLNLIEGLKKEGKIGGLEDVLKRAEKKYYERISGIDKVNGLKKKSKWSEIKKKQKQELKEEHEKKYKTTDI
ncbi:nucleotide pyrophosphohydrolase [Candidatus Gracilibacteria bacterium]|nr:MAG: nucleotide pyrophosphohydrolase [Candidatus Gracilibacteria bacterium]PIE85664.1 MAG: nucleotide pyrophosphohydrolase [Candidatus Gracilibacteria bacterium]